MKNMVSNSFIALALGLSLAACSNSDENKSGNGDAGNGDAAAGGSGASGAGGASGSGGATGSGGDAHHGGSSGAPGSAGMGGHMTGSGGMAHHMMDGGMMDGSMMDGSMMDGGPYALVIDSVMPLEGGLHVMWTNHRTDCDKIELWRNKNGGQYALAYTLAASVDAQHDTQATSPGTYCYKARCVKGSAYSESNEKCGSP